MEAVFNRDVRHSEVRMNLNLVSIRLADADKNHRSMDETLWHHIDTCKVPFRINM